VKAPESWPRDLTEAFKKKVEEFWANPDNETAYDCNDNFRAARVGNAREEAAFLEDEQRGCCGSFEIEWDFGGVKVKYGFNYGH